MLVLERYFLVFSSSAANVESVVCECMLLLSKEDVKESGRRGLRRITWEQGDFPDHWTHAHPNFSEMIAYLHRRVSTTI